VGGGVHAWCKVCTSLHKACKVCTSLPCTRSGGRGDVAGGVGEGRSGGTGEGRRIACALPLSFSGVRAFSRELVGGGRGAG
jgi:hypothetical protein